MRGITFRPLLSALLAAAACASTASARQENAGSPNRTQAAASKNEVALTTRQRLAVEVMRNALAAAGITPLNSQALNLAVLLSQEAVVLNPDAVDLWRLTLDIAGLAERDDLRDAAAAQVLRLDPSDQSMRLLRLNRALERYQTVEDRAKAYEELLHEDNLPRVGAPLASRLALDYALLRNRLGDTEGFARWLSKANDLDRSNRAAAALAAGFFQAHAEDPVGRAELLVNLVMADPTDLQTQASLAQHLLDHGAYRAANRMYKVVLGATRTLHQVPAREFLADLAVAQWASGDSEAALTTIEHRQSEIDEIFRSMQARENPELSMVEITQLKGPIDPMLAAVAAVIQVERRSETAAAAVQAAIAAAEAEIAAIESEGAAIAVEQAARHLQIAWLAFWLADDAALADTHIAAAEQLAPLSEEAKQRYEGWRALKAGDHSRAIDLLTPLAEQDAPARVALALALNAAQRTRDAARELLALNAQQPGSLIGIWAAGELTHMLGDRVALNPQAAALEKLIASVSQNFDRYATDSSMAMGLRAVAGNANPGPYEPIPITITLTNNSNLPLALDRDGPLRPQALVVPSFNTSLPLQGEVKPFIVRLDRLLRLAPNESVSTTFDLRCYSAGEVLNAVAVTGGIVKLVVQTNFIAQGDGTIVPGLYGREIQGVLLRVDGVRRDVNWMEDAIARLNDPATPAERRMLDVALISDEWSLRTSLPNLSDEDRARIDLGRAAVVEAFPKLAPDEQAWCLMVMRPPVPDEAILAMARKSESRYVRLAYVMRHLTDVNDPMLDAARRGDDAFLRQVAEQIRSTAPATTPDGAAGTPPQPALPAVGGAGNARSPAPAATAPASSDGQSPKDSSIPVPEAGTSSGVATMPSTSPD